MRSLRFTQRVEPSRPLFALMAAGLLAACAEPEDRTSRAQDDDDEEAGSQVQAAKSVVAPRADGRAAHYVVFEGPSAIAAARGLTGAAKTARIREVAAQLRAQHDPVRARIEAEGGIVVADLVLVANAMQVRVPPEALRAVRAMPMVTGLEAPTVHHASLAEAVPLLGATEVWQSASGLHGQGVRIGVIDTGIDYTHADLGGRGDPDNYDDNDRDVIEAGTFPTLKVIGGRDLAGDAYDASAFLGDPVPSPDADPLDCSGHGTHVAAIAAGTGVSDDGTPYVGPYDVSLEPGAFAIHPGAAPRASLFAIKIFGCTGSTDLVLPAFELAADPNEDGDTSDRLDVLNLSLGGSFAGRPRSEVELAAVAALTEAGTLVVASAGNTPVASFAVGYPASQPAALAVAATLKELAQYSFAGVEVTAPAATAGIYPLGLPNSAPGLAQIDGFSGQAVVAEPDLACEALTNGGDLAGKVAIVRDGVCDVVDKVAHAADAGAVAVLVVDNEHWNLPGPILGPHALPTFGVRRAEGEALIAASPLSVSFDAASTVVVELGPDYVAPFSSRGPTADEARLKPDLAVPGQDILSAQVGTGASGQVRSGTSMATPLAAGAAALLRQARPELGPLEVKELLTSSAKAVAGPLYRFPATLAGAGRLQIDDAIAATISARMEGTEGETGVSFGSIVASSDHTGTRTVVVTNRRATSVTLDLEIEPALEWPGMTVSVSPSSVVVPAGESATVELSLGISPDSLPPAPVYSPYTGTRGAVTLEGGVSSVATVLYAESSGRLVVRDGASDEAAVVSYYGIARAGAERAVASVDGASEPLGRR